MKYGLRYDGQQVPITETVDSVEVEGMLTAAYMILRLLGYEVEEVLDTTFEERDE